MEGFKSYGPAPWSSGSSHHQRQKLPGTSLCTVRLTKGVRIPQVPEISGSSGTRYAAGKTQMRLSLTR